MASVFSGVRHHHHDVNLELSLEMNRKMQSVLEDTLLKNITLKVQHLPRVLICLPFFLKDAQSVKNPQP